MRRSWIIGVLCLVVQTACERSGEAQAAASTAAGDASPSREVAVCTILGTVGALPDEVRETSGLAQSRRDPELFWTHNDAGNAPELFSVSTEGRLVARLSVTGADAADWEDIESGPCETGNCLFIGDIGDNDAERDRITIYRVPEPAPGATETGVAAAFHGRYPQGARDAEGLIHLPNGEVYLVTKGRRGPIELYRFGMLDQPGQVADLTRVRELLPEPADDLDRVTAATASPDGQWVGIRSYRTLYLYRTDRVTSGGPAEPTVVDLTPLGQAQGESLAISADGTVWLSTEAENKDARPTWARLKCDLSGGEVEHG